MVIASIPSTGKIDRIEVTTMSAESEVRNYFIRNISDANQAAHALSKKVLQMIANHGRVNEVVAVLARELTSKS